MNSTKEKAYERIKKKRIWPSIVTFLGAMLLCPCLIALFAQFFAIYITGMKLEQKHEELINVRDCFVELTEQGKTIPLAMEEIDTHLLQDGAAYITDDEGKVLACAGNSAPNIEAVMYTPLNRKYRMVADSDESMTTEKGIASLFGVSLSELISKTFHREETADYQKWFQEPVLDHKFWMQIPLTVEDCQLYVRCRLQIRRADVWNVCVFAVLVIFLLMVPIFFLSLNTIRAVVLQRQMMQLLYRDIVTGGWNRFYFENSAKQILTGYRNRRRAYAIVELHIERYQNYCACYGVRAGEELLQSMDGFLRARTTRDEVIARYEGADFGLLFPCPGQNVQEYRNYCQTRLRSLLAELSGLRPEQKLHFHAGIYIVLPETTEIGRSTENRKNVDVNQLFTYANTAGAESKYGKEKGISFFEPDMLEERIWNQWVEKNMEFALLAEEFQVYLQPKCSPTEEKIMGAEALVRWNSPEKGIVQPGRFIPIFEENGFIMKLDDYIISHVAKLLAEWTIQGRKMVPISINISRAHFVQEGLAEHICQLVDAYGTSHELIELELTETAFFDEQDILIETVKQLKAYGFSVSMDDFGTGYSSLNTLKDIPLDVLKLDTEFFRESDNSERGEIIVREAIRLAKELKMHVVAEGIEKKEQVDFLANLGCDLIQGFYFARPMPVPDFEKRMESDA